MCDDYTSQFKRFSNFNITKKLTKENTVNFIVYITQKKEFVFSLKHKKLKTNVWKYSWNNLKLDHILFTIFSIKTSLLRELVKQLNKETVNIRLWCLKNYRILLLNAWHNRNAHMLQWLLYRFRLFWSLL